MNPELTNQIYAFLDHQSSIDDLRSWIAAHLDVLLRNPISQEADCVAAIEDILMEAKEKHLSESSIHEKIRALVSTIRVEISKSSTRISSGASNQTVYLQPVTVRVVHPAPMILSAGNLSGVVSKQAYRRQ
jgi:hypothetical protein